LQHRWCKKKVVPLFSQATDTRSYVRRDDIKSIAKSITDQYRVHRMRKFVINITDDIIRHIITFLFIWLMSELRFVLRRAL
jgi:hypothetical protein